jgi:hypothetical protein
VPLVGTVALRCCTNAISVRTCGYVCVCVCVLVNIARTAEEIFTKFNITEILPAHSTRLESDNNESSDGVMGGPVMPSLFSWPVFFYGAHKIVATCRHISGRHNINALLHGLSRRSGAKLCYVVLCT